MADQGFNYPPAGQADWDEDLNENFRLLERGYAVPGVAGPTTIVSGQLVRMDPSSGFFSPYSMASVNAQPPFAVALQVTSPGNTGYFLTQGVMEAASLYGGHIFAGAALYASPYTPGFIVASAFEGSMVQIGFGISSTAILFRPIIREPTRLTAVECGFAHAASADTSCFSFAMRVGRHGINTQLRVRTLSCDNYRVRFYADSARASVLYDTAVLSGNLSVRTNDLIDAAMWPFEVTDVASPLTIYGRVDVLSSAATAINSDRVRVDWTGFRWR